MIYQTAECWLDKLRSEVVINNTIAQLDSYRAPTAIDINLLLLCLILIAKFVVIEERESQR